MTSAIIERLISENPEIASLDEATKIAIAKIAGKAIKANEGVRDYTSAEKNEIKQAHLDAGIRTCKFGGTEHSIENLHVGHDTAWSRGGAMTVENTFLVCQHHNSRQSDMSYAVAAKFLSYPCPTEGEGIVDDEIDASKMTRMTDADTIIDGIVMRRCWSCTETKRWNDEFNGYGKNYPGWRDGRCTTCTRACGKAQKNGICGWDGCGEAQKVKGMCDEHHIAYRNPMIATRFATWTRTRGMKPWQ